ncbi:MAG: hypothetical protein K940chlam3_00217 [Chlamydiae bacterium]|nr:hypothetical protein [Chlamydiota bacterium]
MLKESTYPEKYQMIQEWLPLIIQSIRKDLRQGHLKKDRAFLMQHFQGKNPNKLTIDELVAGYAPLLKEGNEELWEFFIDRWLLKHTDIYYFFEQNMKEIDEEFTELDEIELSVAKKIAEESTQQFGAKNTFIFSVLNSVVFPKEVYDQLQAAARESVVEREEPVPESSIQDHSSELKRLENRYEKKLLGLQKKYDRDVTALKKQIANLQKKLTALHE